MTVTNCPDPHVSIGVVLIMMLWGLYRIDSVGTDEPMQIVSAFFLFLCLVGSIIVGMVHLENNQEKFPWIFVTHVNKLFCCRSSESRALASSD